MNEKIKLVEAAQMRADIPEIHPGDTLKVHVKVVEGDKERLQLFQGILISIRGVGMSKTITVRKISHGVGVERIIPLHSPIIEKIEVVKRGKVRRAKLFYMRNRTGKAAMKIKEKTTNSEMA
ncbi:ribosomal protein L19 [Chloroherpeton thalassium ATCC 35110]|uniref:Large ribosomal subunit protein bL19 n=1 Tax=Chloroherpeton thalassium (strain ATCC 35110 / GB-78) TaxID=517418 RepID=RL19_CHLT3|nr:50S ribosomal protein L19 [Chloroherpeton thalassium]B3QXJ5.1 RecName: Full=Large ribosomal subunit protein bL19; AltName: Full=50S ribosomal protein L19 [Chloroherpeton thalassium ATCC 35110]ACF14910.1 ribosomal protein L19 [Chloroherpeton thalassium ATCC 35110]